MAQWLLLSTTNANSECFSSQTLQQHKVIGTHPSKGGQRAYQLSISSQPDQHVLRTNFNEDMSKTSTSTLTSAKGSNESTSSSSASPPNVIICVQPTRNHVVMLFSRATQRFMPTSSQRSATSWRNSCTQQELYTTGWCTQQSLHHRMMHIAEFRSDHRMVPTASTELDT